jgi:hypothetical protein
MRKWLEYRFRNEEAARGTFVLCSALTGMVGALIIFGTFLLAFWGRTAP